MYVHKRKHVTGEPLPIESSVSLMEEISLDMQTANKADRSFLSANVHNTYSNCLNVSYLLYPFCTHE